LRTITPSSFLAVKVVAMQFAREPLVGSHPYPYDLAWRQVHEIGDDAGLVLSLVAGAVLCMATFVLWILTVSFRPIRIDYTTLAVATVMVLVFHELAHAATFACGRARGLRVECVWQKYRLHLRYHGAVSRSRYIAVLLAPLVVVSIAPIVASILLPLHSGDLVLISLLNSLASGGDAIAAALVLLQVPANAVVQRRGECVIWRPVNA
jgi:putative zincin peptidase